MLDELTIILTPDIYDENQEIFKQGQVSDKVYILARGKIELFLNISEGELYLDTLSEPGSVLAQASLLHRQKLTYCARAKEDVELLSISYDDLMQYKSLNHMQPLTNAIERYFETDIDARGLTDRRERMWTLDYQRCTHRNTVDKHSSKPAGKLTKP